MTCVRDPKHRLAPTAPLRHFVVVDVDDTSYFPDWLAWAHREDVPRGAVEFETWFWRACHIASWRVR